MLTSGLRGFCGAAGGGGGAVSNTIAAALQYFLASQCLLNEPWPPQHQVINGSSFDFIVVGGGTAGAALAARLTETSAHVLLLEAGGDPPQESVIPGFKDVLKGGIYDWNYTTVNNQYSSQALSDGQQRQLLGKMLGGTGSINDMVYSRGYPADYREWASVAGDDWNWDAVLDAFKKTEHMTDENIINNPELMKYHGVNGEIEVTGSNASTYTTDRFLEAFQELGFDAVDDMTYPNRLGVGRFSHMIRQGHRDSSATALLNKAGTRDNLFVVKDAFVTKILIENDTAYGVDVLLNEEHFHFYAKKEVILSAGAFNTPKIMMLSGVGPSEHLKNLDIVVKKDLPVGDNLHDHVMLITYVAAENGSCFTDQGAVYMDMIKYLYDRTGVFSFSNSMGVYIASRSDPDVPDFAIYPSCIPINSSYYEGCSSVLNYNHEICSFLDAKNRDYEILSLAVVLLNPKSRGKVRLASTDPHEAPLIYSGTFENSEDLAGYPDAMEIAYSIANTSYFNQKGAHVVDFDIELCQGLERREQLACTARAMAMSAWHAVGTVPMGSVVDSRLKVMGLSGLRVVDASVMPKVVRGNTNAPVVMIAERAAEFIKEDYNY